MTFPAQLPPVVIGMLISSLSYAMFTAYDTTIKYLTERNSVFMAMAIAYVASAIMLVGWLRHTKKEKWRDELKVRFWKYHAIRAGAVMIAQALFFTAIPHIPLTEFYVILFIIPILVALLAVPLLEEKMTVVLIGCLLASFAGILLALLPQRADGAGFNFWHMIVLVGSFVNSFGHIALRKMMARGEKSAAPAFTSVMALTVGFIICAMFTPANMPSFGDFLLMLLAGFFYAVASLLLPKAFSMATASLVAAPAFLQLVYGAITGYLVFHFVPPVWTYLGGGVVILANLFLLYEQRKIAAAHSRSKVV